MPTFTPATSARRTRLLNQNLPSVRLSSHVRKRAGGGEVFPAVRRSVMAKGKKRHGSKAVEERKGDAPAARVSSAVEELLLAALARGCATSD